MGTKKKVRAVRGSQRYSTKEFKPYVVALGRLTRAWNDLQESLAALFWTLANYQPSAGAMINYNPLVIWSSIKSDRTQREMLKSVINRSAHFWGDKRALDDLNWLLDRCNELEDLRNNAVHSPLFSVRRSLYGIFAFTKEEVAPAEWLFNPRAMKLAERSDLLGEFKYCHDAAIALSDFARLADQSLVNWQAPNSSWPKKPSLPSRPPKKNLQDQHPQPLKKPRPPQPRSSPG